MRLRLVEVASYGLLLAFFGGCSVAVPPVNSDRDPPSDCPGAKCDHGGDATRPVVATGHGHVPRLGDYSPPTLAYDVGIDACRANVLEQCEGAIHDPSFEDDCRQRQRDQVNRFGNYDCECRAVCGTLDQDFLSVDVDVTVERPSAGFDRVSDAAQRCQLLLNGACPDGFVLDAPSLRMHLIDASRYPDYLGLDDTVACEDAARMQYFRFQSFSCGCESICIPAP